MGAELDRSDWDFVYEAIQQFGPMVIELATLDFWGISQEMAPVGQYPQSAQTGGALRGSIQYQTTDIEGIVGTNLEYAPYVHEGFPAHDIEAVNAEALGPFAMSSYLGVKVGGFVGKYSAGKHNISTGLQFFKKVHHPGYEGNPFFENAMPIVEANADEYGGLAMERLGLNG